MKWTIFYIDCSSTVCYVKLQVGISKVFEVVLWMCVVGGLHSEGERVECTECWRCGDMAARGHACLLHRGQEQPPLESVSMRVPPGFSGLASLPACCVGVRLGHHAAYAALDESENGKYR